MHQMSERTHVVVTYTLREAGVRMMRILESLDIQLNPSSSSERIGNIGEILEAWPTFILDAFPSSSCHIPPTFSLSKAQYQVWWLTVASNLFDKGGLHWRPTFYFTPCLPCQWLLPIYSTLPSNFKVMYTIHGKSNCPPTEKETIVIFIKSRTNLY